MEMKIDGSKRERECHHSPLQQAMSGMCVSTASSLLLLQLSPNLLYHPCAPPLLVQNDALAVTSFWQRWIAAQRKKSQIGGKTTYLNRYACIGRKLAQYTLIDIQIHLKLKDFQREVFS